MLEWVRKCSKVAQGWVMAHLWLMPVDSCPSLCSPLLSHTLMVTWTQGPFTPPLCLHAQLPMVSSPLAPVLTTPHPLPEQPSCLTFSPFLQTSWECSLSLPDGLAPGPVCSLGEFSCPPTTAFMAAYSDVIYYMSVVYV